MSASHHRRVAAPCVRTHVARSWSAAAGRSATTRIIALLAATVLSACSTTTPPLRFHSLLDSQAVFAGAAGSSSATTPIRLTITPIQIPVAVDRPQWLVRRGDDTLQLLEQDRWAAPLADELKAAIRARLWSRWNVVDAALPTSGTVAAEALSWRLVLEVLRLDARPAVDVQLEARWTLLAPLPRSAAVACSLRIVEPVQGEGSLPIGEAYRRATIRLADWIGVALRAGEGSGAPSCGVAPAS